MKTSEYGQFESIVTEIREGVSENQYLGGGSEAQIWRASSQGENYAVKIVNKLSPRGRPRDIGMATRSMIDAGIRGLGINGLEQIYAASTDDGVAVYKYVQGTGMEIDGQSVPDEQIVGLLDTIRYATDAGIIFDGLNASGANAIYNTESGFTLIDYWAAGREISVRDNTKFALRSLGKTGIILSKRIGEVL